MLVHRLGERDELEVGRSVTANHPRPKATGQLVRRFAHFTASQAIAVEQELPATTRVSYQLEISEVCLP